MLISTLILFYLSSYDLSSSFMLSSGGFCLGLPLVARIVCISFCIKAQGRLLPNNGQRLPLGQNTSLPKPCFLILSLEQGKQNL